MIWEVNNVQAVALLKKMSLKSAVIHLFAAPLLSTMIRLEAFLVRKCRFFSKLITNKSSCLLFLLISSINNRQHLASSTSLTKNLVLLMASSHVLLPALSNSLMEKAHKKIPLYYSRNRGRESVSV